MEDALAALEALALEPRFEVLDSEARLYSRPLLGSESFVDQMARLSHGMSESVFGVTLRTDISAFELKERAHEAVMRLRFHCPVLASSIEEGKHHPVLRSFVCKCTESFDDANKWASETLMVMETGVSIEELLRDIVRAPLPYVHSDGHVQYFKVILLLAPNPSDHHGLFLHGTHAYLDGAVALGLLSQLLEWIIAPTKDTMARDLPWGEEWQNLPVGPVNSTGGLKPGAPAELLGMLHKLGTTVMGGKPSYGLKPQRTELVHPNEPILLSRILDADTTARLIERLKVLGSSVSRLVEAVQALTAFRLNTDFWEGKRREEEHVVLDDTMVDNHRSAIVPYNGINMCVSNLTIFALDVPASIIPFADSKVVQLLTIMKHLQAQHDQWLASPHLSHLMAAQATLAPLLSPWTAPNPYSPVITSLGEVDRTLPSMFHSPEGNSIYIEEMIFRQRITGLTRTATHVWRYKGKIHVQVQANDVWDEEYLQFYLNDFLGLLQEFAQCPCAVYNAA